MSNPLEPQIAPTLTRLERFWVWNRKELVQQVRQLAQTADTHTAHLATHRQTVMDDLNKARADLAKLTLAHQSLCADHVQLQATHTQLHSTADALRHESDVRLAQRQHSMAELAALHMEHTGLQASHTTLESTHSALQDAHMRLQDAHDRWFNEARTLQSQFVDASAALSQLTSIHHDLRVEHGQLHEAHATQAQRLAERDVEHESLCASNAQLRQEFANSLTQLQQSKADLTALRSEHALLESSHTTLAGENSALQDTQKQLQGVHNRLVGETEILRNQLAQSRASEADMQQRYALVERILKSEPLLNPALSELQHWLSSEFVQELQQLELPSDFTAQALLQAQAIGMHVELLAESPALHDKFLVAVAGGFNSGKSSFVSSFMGPETASLLATGIQPVTAIPTYVMPGGRLSIQGHSYKRASVPLDKETYGRLSHEFLARMGFNLKQIMPFVVIEAPMRQIEHMAFIDMPGYDSAASAEAHTAGDRKTAGAALAEADAVIWLVGADTNGTLPADDLEFLLDHANNKPLYVVINKADQRSAEHLKSVLLDIQNLLEDNGLRYAGISAYSSILGEELFHCGQSIAEVFQHWDHISSAAAAVHKEFDVLMNRLEAASQTAHAISEDVHGLVHSLGVDLYELSTYLPVEENTAQESSNKEMSGFFAANMGWLKPQVNSNGARSDNQTLDEDRAPRLRKQAEDKLARLKASTARVEQNRTVGILEKLRMRGHDLLQQSCGDGSHPTSPTLGQWID